MSTIPQHLLGRYAVLLFDSKGIVSSLIRWQTFGQVSHAGMLLPDGRCLESMQGPGVRIRELTDADWDRIEAYDVEGMTELHWEIAIAFAQQQKGKKYDWWGVIRFITRSWMPENDRWFCSELLFEAILRGGIALLARIASWAVDPARLRTSPRLIPRWAGKHTALFSELGTSIP